MPSDGAPSAAVSSSTIVGTLSSGPPLKGGGRNPFFVDSVVLELPVADQPRAEVEHEIVEADGRPAPHARLENRSTASRDSMP